MQKITLTDEPKWFDADTSTKFNENTWWNGNNHISKATGSQWDHEALWYTSNKNWVLNRWSQWQGVQETYTEITEAAAIEWLISQEVSDLGDLPDAVRDRVEAGMEAAEI